MSRALVVPAAGTGSRLGSPHPKVLHPVAGRPMLAHLAALHAPWIDAWHLVVRPQDREVIGDACQALGLAARLHVQPRPTGMLDAVLRAHDAIAADAPDEVWITWCALVALRPETRARRAAAPDGPARWAIRMPTCWTREPYIHLDRDGGGRIAGVRHRREGDAMPEIGEADAGLFALRGDVYVGDLPRFAAEDAGTGSQTAERNFLPFLAWPGLTGPVETFPCADESETIGINTPADLAAVERVLAAR
jgi:bifunctional UDP-N-acetylglucosamine pyrophosphorylase/glucosamine-1-phosphate N-acetyltransferase